MTNRVLIKVVRSFFSNLFLKGLFLWDSFPLSLFQNVDNLFPEQTASQRQFGQTVLDTRSFKNA